MPVIDGDIRTKLFTQLKHTLGAPIRGVELVDEQLDSLLEVSIQDYSQYVNDWLVENQWSSLYGLNIDTQDVQRAFITRSLDYETSFTFAYSKIVGLQAGGNWELKKDFLTLSGNTQIYQVPAGREINEVLWFNRPERDQIYADPVTGGFGGFGGGGSGAYGGFAQFGAGYGSYMFPAFDVVLAMQDRTMKNRVIGSDLTYKITAGPNGTKFIHLMPVPGGRYDNGNTIFNQGKVWYWYYDTENRDQCLAENADVVRLPSDVPLDNLKWADLNTPAQTWIRKYFFASAKETLGLIRGKFSGNLKVPDSELTMDYQMLLTQAKDDKMKLIEELNQRLERLGSLKMLERKGMEAENLNKSLKFRPMNPGSIYII